MLALSVAVCSFVAPAGTASRGSVAAATAAAPVAPHVRMMNLFGRTEESKKQREFLSLRDAPSGSTRVQFRKPNQATTGPDARAQVPRVLWQGGLHRPDPAKHRGVPPGEVWQDPKGRRDCHGLGDVWR